MRKTPVLIATVVVSLGLMTPAALSHAMGTSGTSGSGGLSLADAESSNVRFTKSEKDRYRQKAADVQEKRKKRVTQEQREKAAARALQKGALNPLMAVEPAQLVGGAPRYFSHPNYANSPLPEVTTGAPIQVGNPLQERGYATDNATNVFVVLPDALPNGFITSFQSWNQASAGGSSMASAGLNFHAYVLRPTGTAGEYLVAFDSGQLTVPALTQAGVSEVATFDALNIAVQAGDRIAFYGQGVPMDIGAGTDAVYWPANTPPLQDSTITVGADPYPLLNQQREYSFAANVIDLGQTTITGGMRKFVDELPQFGTVTGPGVAVPDTSTYPGSSYYEIALVEYEQKMHADLPPTKLRGYVQLKTDAQPGTGVPLVGADGNPILLPDGTQAVGVTAPSYLGPAIVTDKDAPVRILFRNLLPTGNGGNLFIPTDTTVMGSGMTADGHALDPATMDPQNPMCSEPTKSTEVAAGNCYAENRATLHLHGGITPWISDGTPHQWITPAGENTKYPDGVSVQHVPDMWFDTNGNQVPAGTPDATNHPGPGAQTFFYTNAQSARLMFYHDHAWGITRLNVYAGEAAPYIITDDTEKALVKSDTNPTGVLPPAADTIPLVVQDKTFVPNAAQLARQDEGWDSTRWGGEGDLWVPHIYSPAQNPGDASGVNAFGRWAYGPWFWPPTSGVEHGPIDNPYFDPACDPDVQWCEPPKMPGTPYVSMGMESFNDTPVVNGTAYPTVTIDPKSYRFRILNGANDRFFNLSLYQAVDANDQVCNLATNPNPVAESTGVACTEVALNPAEVAAALTDTTVFPTPVAGTEGPDWIQVGTEGGFLPAPVVTPAQPTTWVNDPTVFNAGNVDQHSLLMGPAERHDVVVDFSQYAGQTLILYNDAPAAFPARDPRYDYYTGNADLTDTGGATSTLRGYGPNTRTVMQIKVANTAPAPAFDLVALQNAFKSTSLGGGGAFEQGQKPIIVGQGAYNSAYGTTFQNNGPYAGLVQIYDTSLTFDRLIEDAVAGPPYTTSAPGQRLTMPLAPKMIQDEQGEAFDRDYGRMSGFLGVETPNAQAGLQNMILAPFASPPTEVIDGVERDEVTMPDGSPLPAGVDAVPIASANDGTQIWKFTHNGVDTHPIHFHLFDVQVLNRVGWDGIIRKPHPSELGWKDTLRISPLEDTIVALRPIIPPIPDTWGGLPNSIRLLNPSMPEGAFLENTTAREAAGLPIFAFNPDGEPIDVVNHFVNYGWEYVYHCHILSHEEMDMMHGESVGIKPTAPTGVSWVRSGSGRNQQYAVSWTDTSKNETAFVVERRAVGSTGGWTAIATVPSAELGVVPFVRTDAGPGTGARSYTDLIGSDRTLYEYQVYAVNVVGDVWDYSDPALNNIPPGGGFPTLVLDSRGGASTTVADPTNLTANAVVRNRKAATVNLAWTDNSNNETGFLIQRADNAIFSAGVVNATVGGNLEAFSQTVTPGRTYYYRVLAFNDTHQSGWSNTASVSP